MRRNWPREGRQPVRDAGGPVREASPAPGGTGLRPSRGKLRVLRRIFADAKILVSDFCVPHGAKIRALTREGRFSAKVAYYASA